MEVETRPIDGWITKDEACQRLGLSLRTIENYILGRKISTRMKPMEGRKPLPVLSSEDVERIAAERNRGAILPGKSPGSTGPNPGSTGENPGTQLARMDDFTRLLEVVLKARAVAPASLPPAPKPFMTLEEAAEFTSLPLQLLKRFVRDGRLGAERYQMPIPALPGEKRRTRTVMYVKTSDLRSIDFFESDSADSATPAAMLRDQRKGAGV